MCQYGDTYPNSPEETLVVLTRVPNGMSLGAQMQEWLPSSLQEGITTVI